MKIIIKQGSLRYKNNTNIERSQLQRYIQSHRFYTSSINIHTVIQALQQTLKKNNQLGSRSQSNQKQYQPRQSSDQLSLYLNKENNKQIFSLFELITAQPKGITYEALSKKLKTDIITISHYCCKLKKLRLIDWDHEKEGIIVFPKVEEDQRGEKQIKYIFTKNQVGYDFQNSFLFKELGMNQNIWINVSSEQSISKGGLTNQQIKRKIMKHAQNKMVRRTVESMKYFDRHAERQGKVFQFKYKNETEKIKDQMIRKDQIEQQIDILDEVVQDWLKQKFPQFEGDNFLRDLINTKFKDYISSLGIKQSKRQCTPLKLNRYIKVLNYLNKYGGMRQNELRNLIIRDEKQINHNIGIMHKRSLMGILQGLKNLKIIFQENTIYYPSWIQQSKKIRWKDISIIKKIQQPQQNQNKKKNQTIQKLKIQKKQINQKNKYKIISQKRYKLELFLTLLFITFDKLIKKIYRKGFNRIVYVQRKKISHKFIPQNNILHLIDNYNHLSQCKIIYNNTLESFYQCLDNITQKQYNHNSILEECENQIIKFIRKNPIKNSNSLRIKYGKNWKNKFELLEQKDIIRIDQDGIKLNNIQSYLI